MIDPFDLDLGDVASVEDHARVAARSGDDKSACPLAPSDPHWAAWQREWTAERSNMERESGEMGRRTAAMKAEVRRQTEHLYYIQPDPCAEMLPERPVSPLAAVGINALQVQIQGFADAFTAAMECMAEILDNYDLPAMLADIQAIADAVEAPKKARLRHGSAASCPRHGETRGGTCMKCARTRR